MHVAGNAPFVRLAETKGSWPGARPGQLQGRRPCSGLPNPAGQGQEIAINMQSQLDCLAQPCYTSCRNGEEERF